MKVSVIIPAAGLGTRMGRSAPEKEGISRKQFMLLNGSPILVHTIRKFVSSPLVTEIVDRPARRRSCLGGGAVEEPGLG